jgi:hypothetical protein
MPTIPQCLSDNPPWADPIDPAWYPVGFAVDAEKPWLMTIPHVIGVDPDDDYEFDANWVPTGGTIYVIKVTVDSPQNVLLVQSMIPSYIDGFLVEFDPPPLNGTPYGPNQYD